MTGTWTVEDYERVLDHCVRITSSLEIGRVALDAVEALADMLPGAQAVLCRAIDGVLSPIASQPAVSDEVAAVKVPFGTGLVGLAARERRPVYSPDVQNDVRTAQHLRALSEDPDRSLFAVPLVWGEDVLGVLYALSPEPDAFDESQRSVLLSLGPTIAAALRNAVDVEERRAALERAYDLDERKALFVWLVSEDLLDPLVRLRELAGSLQHIKGNELIDLATSMMAEARDFTSTLERILVVTGGEGPSALQAEALDVRAALAEIGRAEPGEPAIALTSKERLVRVVARLVPVRSNAIVEVLDDHVRIRIPGHESDGRMFKTLSLIAGGKPEGKDAILLPRPKANA